MSRLMVILIVVPLALCVMCGSIGYVLLQRWESTVSKEMAEIVATSVVASIDASGPESHQLVLTEDDLNVNNALALDGSCGFNVTTDGTQIYGVVTEITPTGIALDCGRYGFSAVPVIEEERVDLTETEVTSSVMRFIVPKNRVERAIEYGINEALESKGLTPTGITLKDSMMLILTESSVS